MISPFVRLSPLLALAFLSACGKKPEARGPVRPAMTMVVEPSPSWDAPLSGTVQPQVQSPFGFRVLGQIIARPVHAGDRVHAGQMLAALDPLALELAERSAAATLASARAQYDNAAGVEARQAELLARKTTAQATFDTAEQARAAAQASMAQAEANLAKAREQLSYAVLKADYDGVVTATSAEIGQTVSPGQAVVTLAEPTRRDAVIDAPDGFAEVLSVGQRFTVAMQLDPARQVSGVVHEIAPQADSATRMRRVKIGLDQPPDSFRLGATISAHFDASAGAAIRLPESALLQEGGVTQVFVVDPKTLAVGLRKIEVAPDRDVRWIVRAGLTPGERVVTAGVHRLQPGQVVRIYGGELDGGKLP